MAQHFILCNGDGSGNTKRWLNGDTIGGGLSLSDVPYTNGTLYLSGTLWTIESANNPDEPNAMKITCGGTKGGDQKKTFLYCDTNDNQVDLALIFNINHEYGQWVLEQSEFQSGIKQYTIKCLDESHGTKYLNGGTGNGSVNIADTSTPTGTLWIVLDGAQSLS